MNTTNLTATNYSELATSTCTPTGGGASRCVYEYLNKVSYSTSTQQLATSTVTFHETATVSMLIGLGIVIATITAILVRKLT